MVAGAPRLPRKQHEMSARPVPVQLRLLAFLILNRIRAGNRAKRCKLARPYSIALMLPRAITRNKQHPPHSNDGARPRQAKVAWCVGYSCARSIWARCRAPL
jgi:hypothetical protein